MAILNLNYKKATLEDYQEIGKIKNFLFMETQIPKASTTRCDWKCQDCEYIWAVSFQQLNQEKLKNKCPNCSKRRKITEEDYVQLSIETGIQYLGPFPKHGLIKTNWICLCGEPRFKSYHHIKFRNKCNSCGGKEKSGSNNGRWNPDRKLVKKRKRIANRVCGMLNYCLRQLKENKAEKHFKLLGFSCEEFKIHMEKLFEPWINWENMGNGYKSGEEQKWSIDHIKPIAQFVKEGITDASIINALTNLRPLDANENRSKNDRMENGKRASQS